MRRKQFRILGEMSGTSLDGIDLAYLAFTRENGWEASILKAETIPYPQKWVEVLKASSELSRPEITALDEKYTDYLAEIIQQFIQKNKIEKLDAVCSHGHTVLHQPEEGFTVQIGNLPKLATILQQKVVCDFRVQDVELGGQGAPLVPIGDRLLFSDYDYCLNLGGFANISREIEFETETESKRIAYDICPVNTVLNEYASRLGFAFDRDGAIARNAEVNQNLLKELNALSFYQQKPPKSLGIEWVNSVIFPILEKSESTSEEIIATFTQHVAVQLSENIQHHSSRKVLVTRGGA
ncbi:anhydro-N-acetylmuramic acid kinase, partial [Aquimarina celericrescens]|nr:anhydro-N-acetylmuramic acid kinase [Aquimarina celericrescens]